MFKPYLDFLRGYYACDFEQPSTRRSKNFPFSELRAKSCALWFTLPSTLAILQKLIFACNHFFKSQVIFQKFFNVSSDLRTLVKTSFLRPEIKPHSRKIRLGQYNYSHIKMICKTKALPSYLPLKDVYQSNHPRSRFYFGFNVQTVGSDGNIRCQNHQYTFICGFQIGKISCILPVSRKKYGFLTGPCVYLREVPVSRKNSCIF